MFVLSKIHAWQNDPAVQQVLVFSSEEMKTKFEETMKQRLAEPEVGVEDVSDSDAGAIYKLRAVKDSNGSWIPVVRCGFNGKKLWEGRGRYGKPEFALRVCVGYLQEEFALCTQSGLAVNFK